MLVLFTEDSMCSAFLMLFPWLLSLSLPLLLLQYSNSYLSCFCSELKLSALNAERSVLFHLVSCSMGNNILHLWLV